ncbi:MAG: CotH kinase family protein [Ruminococcus sp.]|nr:CotH kinase family protein [Ruminococcus sp.]
MKRFISIILCAAVMLGVCCAAGVGAEEITNMVPRVYVTTDNGNGNTIEKEDGYVEATVKIEDTDGTVLEDAADFKVRGNSTALAEKKPFTFKFNNKKNVLGMGKAKKWVLFANCGDPTLMRNYIAFEIARELGIAYTSEQRYVELWVDGVFKGCYTLIEPVQAGKERVNIDTEGNNGKKDFLLEYETVRVEEDVTYVTSNGYRFIVSEPKNPTEEQLAYIQNVLDPITSAFISKDYSRMEAAVDIDSFAKMYLLNDFVKNVDVNFSSVFFYYKDGQFYAGPPWDYDLASGNPDPSTHSSYKMASDPEGLYAAYTGFFYYLMMKTEFRNVVEKLYTDHYAFFRNIYAQGGMIDTMLAQYGDVYARNFGEAGWKEDYRYIPQQRQPLPTFAENVVFLRDWYQKRNASFANDLSVYGVSVVKQKQSTEDPHALDITVDLKKDYDFTGLYVEYGADEPMYFRRTIGLDKAKVNYDVSNMQRVTFHCELPVWVTSGKVFARIVMPDRTPDLEPRHMDIAPFGSGDELIMGDVNGDGAVNIDDATEIQKICAALITPDKRQTLVGDVDGNGALDITEATQIQKYLAETGEEGYTANIGKSFRAVL